MDHFGPLTVNDGIRMGRALEGLGIAWLEDIMSVFDVDGNRRVTEAINVPTLNGEQAYLLERPQGDDRDPRCRHLAARPGYGGWHA